MLDCNALHRVRFTDFADSQRIEPSVYFHIQLADRLDGKSKRVISRIFVFFAGYKITPWQYIGLIHCILIRVDLKHYGVASQRVQIANHTYQSVFLRFRIVFCVRPVKPNHSGQPCRAEFVIKCDFFRRRIISDICRWFDLPRIGGCQVILVAAGIKDCERYTYR